MMFRLTSLAAAALLGSAALALAQQPNSSPIYPNRYSAQQPATGVVAERQTYSNWRQTMTPSRETRMPTRETLNAGQFSSEGDARAHCGSDTVVWVNTKTHVYHLPGTRDFGQTKRGAFMCQADADRSGKFRAAKNEMRTQGSGTSQMPVSRFSGSGLYRR